MAGSRLKMLGSEAACIVFDLAKAALDTEDWEAAVRGLKFLASCGYRIRVSLPAYADFQDFEPAALISSEGAVLRPPRESFASEAEQRLWLESQKKLIDFGSLFPDAEVF